MKRLAAVLAAAAVAAAGCGGGGGDAGGDATAVLSETAANLREIRSGTLSLRFLATSEGEASGRVGFELEGPFALPEDGGLPVAEMEYTQIAGDEQGEAKFLSTGERAYVEIDGVVYELPEEQQERLRVAGADLESEGGLAELEIERWMQDPELEDGGEVGGTDVDRIAARLDVVNALSDLLAVAGDFGRFAGGGLDEESAEQLERSVESANVEVLTGAEDRLLRSLQIQIDFRAPSDLPPDLRGLLGAALEFELAIDDPNEPVTVEEPEDAQPFPG